MNIPELRDDYEGIPHKCDFGCGVEVERHNQACDPCLISNAEGCGDWDEDAAHALARVRTQELQERVKALEDGLRRLLYPLRPDDGKWPDLAAAACGVKATYTRKQYNDLRAAYETARVLLAPPISEAHAHLLTNPD